MQETLCEMRFDIPLAGDPDARAFERAWRAELSAQKMTALAMPPAQALAARFRVCGPENLADADDLGRGVAARLAALPGGPRVAREPSASAPGWSGVRVWLSYRAQDLPALLGKTSQPKSHKPKKARRGPRP